MNIKVVRFVLSRMLFVEGILLLIPAIVALYFGEREGTAFVFTTAILMLCSVILGIKKPDDMKLYAREGMVIVAGTWVLWSVFGSLPFIISGDIPSIIDSLFETVSGFTTTGSTILREVENLPNSVSFWRSFTHWIGGMGVLVFALAILPLSDNNSMHMMRAEMAGPSIGKLVPKIRQTAKILYGIYVFLTAALILILTLCGMPLFDSIQHAFSTAGAGGFGIKNSNIAHYNSAVIEGVLTVFMFLFGTNFHIFYFLLIRKFKAVWKNSELRVYFILVIAAMIGVALNINQMYGDIFKSFRYAAFHVVSVITTTGYITVDYNLWPVFSKCILLLIMLIGACAGSTAGGIKISRAILMMKTVGKEIKHILRPRSVNIVKMDGRKVDTGTIHGLYSYLIMYVIILGVSTLIVALDNFDFETTFTAVLASISSMGPGFGEAGPASNFADFSVLSKLVLIFDMLLGRLEIFPIIMLFSPSVWKNKF